MLNNLIKDLRRVAKPEKARILSRFFKTGKGEYGEGDEFLGIIVPIQRIIAKKYTDLGLVDIQRLLKSKIHEYRLTALFILVYQYENSRDNYRQQKKIFNFYLKNIKFINNWDLVDLSAPKIVGNYLFNKDKKKLFDLAKSKNLWERRISILSTFTFIKYGEYSDTLKISEILLNDKEDLIHKAVGWMLREVGKRDVKAEKKFLNKFANKMPRTMLRYAIEKFAEAERRKYLDIKLK